MAFIVYKITNIINDKVYIGQTKNNLDKRFARHCTNAAAKNEKCKKLEAAIRKYGQDNFAIEKICECSNKDWLDIMEDHYILLNNSINEGYNIKRGGQSPSGWNHTEASKEKIGSYWRGKKRKPHTPWNKGLKMGPAWNKIQLSQKQVDMIINSNLSQRKLAASIGVSRTVIRRILKEAK